MSFSANDLTVPLGAQDPITDNTTVTKTNENVKEGDDGEYKPINVPRKLPRWMQAKEVIAEAPSLLLI